MGEPTSTASIVTAIGATVLGIPGVGATGVFFRKMWTRGVRTEERVDHFAEALDREAAARKSGDKALSDTLTKMSDTLFEKLEKTTDATNAVNTSLVGLREGNAATLEAIKERLTREEQKNP